MDTTLLAILLVLAAATVGALLQARRRDRCLKTFDGYHVTLAEHSGDLTWGVLDLYPTGLEVRYDTPVVAAGGHLERSFLVYRDQYEALDALFRHAGSLSDDARVRRAEAIRRTVRPGVARRLGRRLRNAVASLRDALLHAVTLVIGAAKARRPGSAVLGTQEQSLKTLSSEIIGYAGNAFDPLLEAHLFREVALEVTQDGRTRTYCGWLADYTAEFVSVVDAFANPVGHHLPPADYSPGGTTPDGVTVAVEDGRLRLVNASTTVFAVEHVAAGAWRRTLGIVLPPGGTADLTLPADVAAAAPEGGLSVRMGSAERVDLVVPRTHALVRHAADGSETRYPAIPDGIAREVRSEA